MIIAAVFVQALSPWLNGFRELPAPFPLPPPPPPSPGVGGLAGGPVTFFAREGRGGGPSPGWSPSTSILNVHAPIALGNPLQCEESWFRFSWGIGERVVPDFGVPLLVALRIDDVPTVTYSLSNMT